MKNLMISLLFLRMAIEGNGGAAPKVEPTSETLTKLRGELAVASQAFSAINADPTKIGSDEWQKSMLDVYNANQKIKTELANIAKHERDLELLAKRNERLKLIDNLLDAHNANLAVQNDKKASIDQKNEANDAFKKVRETLENELLARYATSSPAKKSSDGTTSYDVKTGSKTDEIFALMDAGKTYDDIIAAGYADGTIRSAAWKGKYKKAADGSYTK